MTARRRNASTRPSARKPTGRNLSAPARGVRLPQFAGWQDFDHLPGSLPIAAASLAVAPERTECVKLVRNVRASR